MNNQNILFHSTNYNTPEVDLKTAIFRGQALDYGLYMLNVIPVLKESIIYSFKHLPFKDMAIKLLAPIIGQSIPIEILKSIIEKALNFSVPIELINNNNYICYLDGGPTCSFKDFGARTLANIMEYFLTKENKKIVILTATSGDTGGAVAQAFFEMNNIKVVILYPRNEVSELQRKQMTTLGKNVTAIGIEGKFDDCQRMVKQAFADENLNSLNLTSANSINFGRLLPQVLYYFWAYSRVFEQEDENIIFSVPSGNFGNLVGGLIAFKMGLPVHKFIAAVNENDEFPRFLDSGKYKKVEPSKNCISNAMNVGHPSNLARLIDIYKGHLDENGKLIKKPDMELIMQNIISYSINDELTKQTIIEFYRKFKKIIEPHGAVGWAALNIYRTQFPEQKIIKAICFETANPAKFPEEIISLIDVVPKIPASLELIQKRKEFPISIKISNYQDFKNFLQKNF
ncbi:MAG: threonine synthase [Candidatus Hodarchaeota archaeon]